MKYCNLPSAPRLLPKNVVPEIRDDTLNIWWSRGNDVKIDNYTIFYCTEERDKSIIGCGIVRGKQKLQMFSYQLLTLAYVRVVFLRNSVLMKAFNVCREI